MYDKFTQFGLEVITVEENNLTKPNLDDEGNPQLRWLEYPLQIQDAGGEDTLTSDKLDIKPAAMRGNRIGLAQRGDSLVIDYNQDSYPSLETDIVVHDFFDFDNPGKPGTGFIGNLDGIDGAEILKLAAPFTPIDFTLPEIEQPGFWTNSGTWGDYDNDGDLDFLIASGDDKGNGFTRIYRNDESKFDFSISLEGYSNVNSLAWGDYDNDGDLDALVVGFDNSPQEDNSGNLFPGLTYQAGIYRNEGSDRFTNADSVILEKDEGEGFPPQNQLFLATWANFDNDSDGVYDNKLDILLRGYSTPTTEWGFSFLAENEGNSFSKVTDITEWDWESLSDRGIGYSNNATGAWGDYDNDGDLDLIKGTDLFNNNSDESDERFFNPASSLSDVASENSRVDNAWGDYDGDGDLDLIVTGDVTTIYRNDANSSTAWINQLGTNQFDTAEVIATDANGNIYVAGETSRDLAGDLAENVESDSVWLAKYNSTGDRLWIRQFGTTGVEFPRGITVDNIGNVYLTGFTDSEFGESEGNVWIAKYDTDGNHDINFGNTNNGFIQYGSSGSTESQDLAVDSKGNIYVIGETKSNLDGTPKGDFDAWIQKYDSNGNFDNLPKIGTTESEKAIAIAIRYSHF